MAGYRDRSHAGEVLAGLLAHIGGESPLVLGIPRGGVVVAAGIAAGLQAELAALVAVKVRAPHNPELAVGAVTADGVVDLDLPLLRALDIDAAGRDRLVAVATVEARRRQHAFGGLPEMGGRVVVVADDGVATGATVAAALGLARRAGPRWLVGALPVGPPSTIAALTALADELVCPLQPEPFGAVGVFYDDFSQVSDREVLALLSG